MAFLESFIAASIYILVIIDPLASLPVFLAFTKELSKKEARIAATKAVIIAGILAITFLFVGQQLLDLMHISLKDFKVAGGIILLLLGLQSVIGFSFVNEKERKTTSMETIATLIATPMLTGPGLMTAIIVMVQEVGMLIVTLAIFVALLISWLVLFNAASLKKIVGDQIIEVGSKVLGLLIIAVGISFIKDGLGLTI